MNKKLAIQSFKIKQEWFVIVILVLFIITGYFGYVLGESKGKASKPSIKLINATEPTINMKVIEEECGKKLPYYLMKTWKTKAILCTNRLSGYPSEEVYNLPIDNKIYDVSFMVYSKWFADRYGYPYDHVVKLDKGLHVLEFKMVTNGIWLEYYLNILTDNNLALDVPTQSYVRMNKRFRFPKKRPELKDSNSYLGYYESSEDREYRIAVISEIEKKENYFNHNTRLSTLDDEFNKKGASRGLFIDEYSNTYFKNMDYFSLLIDKYDNNILEQPNASLWLRRITGKNYTKDRAVVSDDFIKFKLPRPFVEKVLFMLKNTGNHESFTVVQSNYDYLIKTENKEVK